MKTTIWYQILYSDKDTNRTITFHFPQHPKNLTLPEAIFLSYRK